MAIRSKTIEYAFPQNEASLAAGAAYDFPEITLYIPETESRIFKGVIVEFTCRDNGIVNTATNHRIDIKLGSAAFSSDGQVNATISNSGENQSFYFYRTAGAYFTSNFGSGISQTCQVRISVGNIVTCNHAVKIIITYEYEDSSASTRIKTVRIPIESVTTQLTDNLVEIGTNQVPNLDTFLPESNKIYRDIFFEITFNNQATGTSINPTFDLALDSESADPDFTHTDNNASAIYYKRIWKRTDLVTNTTHALKMGMSVIGSATMNHPSVILIVTYEYDHTNSTRILNSIVLPIFIESGSSGANQVTAEKIDFNVQELNPILVQSGIHIQYTSTLLAGSTIAVACGSQNARIYSDTAFGCLACGQVTLSHRFDSNADKGLGITFGRGWNTLTVKVTPSHDFMGTISGLIYINYTSDKHSQGDGAHNHTIFYGIMPSGTDSSPPSFTNPLSLIIPESDYYLSSVGFMAMMYSIVGTFITTLIVSGNRTAEFNVTGLQPLGKTAFFHSELETGPYFVFGEGINNFRRYPKDTGLGFNPKLARSWAIQSWANTTINAFYLIHTYHSISYNRSGILIGYNGDGSGVTVTAHITADAGPHIVGEKIDQVISAVGGGYNFTWYDDTVPIYAEARQDNARVGRSNDGVS